MSYDIVIHCKVISVHPFFDAYGNEFVCIEFGLEAQKPPTVMSMPTNIPSEVSVVMPILSQIPKMLGQTKMYTNRLILYLTFEEWNLLQRKYKYGDDLEIKIGRNGNLQVVMVE